MNVFIPIVKCIYKLFSYVVTVRILMLHALFQPSGSAITLKSGALPSIAPQTVQTVRASPQVLHGLRQPQVAISVRPSFAATSNTGGTLSTAGAGTTPSGTTVQPIQVPGSRFNYVRLVNVANSGQQQQTSVAGNISTRKNS